MKNKICDCLGWLFCEISFCMWERNDWINDLSEEEFEKESEWHLLKFTSWMYNTGCYFYGKVNNIKQI